MKDSTINRDIKFEKKKKGISTTSQIILGFFVAILVGAILLTLPIATVDRNTNFLTALFTSTTSVCVTGLVVVDTFSYWSLFGKIVILILIQLGGLGVVAFTSSMLIMFNKKVSLKDRMVIQDAYNLNNLQGMVIFVKKVI
ncbi:MAG: potassium transporter KtrB, partial [Lachnospiraceae bacterium]|nr:potassium transporter KtrB [Lachnospiraceae bacterium]